MLSHMNWDARELVHTMERTVLEAQNGVRPEAAKEFLRRYRQTLNGYVYLNTDESSRSN
ncbi:MAG: hypothetical protein HYT80_09050, partial [Euryarchaeota archaeon]|nr:hypothetical protein [Euryarchaeota archaeon]